LSFPGFTGEDSRTELTLLEQDSPRAASAEIFLRAGSMAAFHALIHEHPWAYSVVNPVDGHVRLDVTHGEPAILTLSDGTFWEVSFSRPDS
jgi:hypothetical protein